MFSVRLAKAFGGEAKQGQAHVQLRVRQAHSGARACLPPRVPCPDRLPGAAAHSSSPAPPRPHHTQSPPGPLLLLLLPGPLKMPPCWLPPATHPPTWANSGFASQPELN